MGLGKNAFDIKVEKSDNIKGVITAPPSKSDAHRALIVASLSCVSSRGENKVCTVNGIISSEDMKATISGLGGLGVSIKVKNGTAFISKKSVDTDGYVKVNCRESGSTLRFLIPIYAALGVAAEFVGKGQLPKRPLDIYADLLPKNGIEWDSKGGLPLKISGKLQAGKYSLSGEVSSQFVSGLLFALPLCDGDSEIILTSTLESASYVDMTVGILKKAGIQVDEVIEGNGGWKIKGNQRYDMYTYQVEGDWSQAAFLLAMGALDGDVTVCGLDRDSYQGDKAVVSILKRFGAEVDTNSLGEIRCHGKISSLHGISICAAQIPDLIPVLSIVAAYSKGETRIFNAERLRIKECDRLTAISDCIERLGGLTLETDSGIIVKGGIKVRKKVVKVSSYNDHRIAMSMAVMGTKLENGIIIENADSVSKSWPNFFDVYRECGGIADVF